MPHAQSTFGRRQRTGARPAHASAGRRRPRATDQPISAPEPEAVGWSLFDPPGYEEPQRSVLAKLYNYAVAIALGFAAMLGALAMIKGSNGALFDVSIGQRLFTLVASAFVAVPAAQLFAIPVMILTRILRSLRIRRGNADIAIGLICGGLWPAIAFSEGRAPNDFEWAFLIAGAAAGWAFWRVQGYPGLRDVQARTVVETAARHVL